MSSIDPSLSTQLPLVSVDSMNPLDPTSIAYDPNLKNGSESKKVSESSVEANIVPPLSTLVKNSDNDVGRIQSQLRKFGKSSRINE